MRAPYRVKNKCYREQVLPQKKLLPKRIILGLRISALRTYPCCQFGGWVHGFQTPEIFQFLVDLTMQLQRV